MGRGSQREKFWSAFFHIWTEYGEILRISPYSVRMRENTDQNNSEYGHFGWEKSEKSLYSKEGLPVLLLTSVFKDLVWKRNFTRTN